MVVLDIAAYYTQAKSKTIIAELIKPFFYKYFTGNMLYDQFIVNYFPLTAFNIPTVLLNENQSVKQCFNFI